MKAHHTLRFYRFVSLLFVLMVTVFVPTGSVADWASDLPSSNVLIKSATVVSSYGSQYTIGSGTSYYNTKYNDTWQIAQQMTCVVNGWDCSDIVVSIEIKSTTAISYEAYVSIGGVQQAPIITGSFGSSGGNASFNFTINGIAWQVSNVVLVTKTKKGTTTYTLPKTGISVNI